MTSFPLPVRLGSSPLHPPAENVTWDAVILEGQPYMRLGQVDALPPFFMSIVSDGDPWLFVGSNGAFTAGRVDPDGALFPYQTVDRILAHPATGGARSVFLVEQGDGWALWEPWQPSGIAYATRRNLYKHVTGTSVRFEETNLDLQLRFSWELTACQAYGVVRSCRLENLGDVQARIRYLDGWHQLLPPGITVDTYAELSYLANAYMRHDRVPGVPLGLYTMNALLTDRAEPAESLRAAAAWSLGHAHPTLLLSDRQVDAFRCGQAVTPDQEVRGVPGACLMVDNLELPPDHDHAWICVADTRLDHAAVVDLQDQLTRPEQLRAGVRAAVAANREGLRRRIASADGLQHSGDPQVCVHHFANVLYNVMRGGILPDGDGFPATDVAAFIQARSRGLYARHRRWLDQLPDRLNQATFTHHLADRDDPQLLRLATEYLPLTFSRRHGDPSRPWNRFAIRVRDNRDAPRYTYEGNWRDIFQNWEGLACSHPAWLPTMINVFLSASTADGYNPYRVTREGIDWDVLDPADPWSHIGYWGDHQIIYLLRLLEVDDQHHPGRLAAALNHRAYAYAMVPYEMVGFDALVSDPRHSIRFDLELHNQLMARAADQGGDGKLLQTAEGEIALVTLAEKLLVPLLAKLTNFVPDGGIWLNTQRPEWNDANNALAGWGLSMVTVYHLGRYLRFCTGLFAQAPAAEVALSKPVIDLVDRVTEILSRSGDDRYAVLEALGRAGETFREVIYRRVPAPTEPVALHRVDALFTAARSAIDATLRVNRRSDGMYHSYNVLTLESGRAEIARLPLMLEGQVAVLQAGCLSSAEAAGLLAALRDSDLYRADQHSYLLYPDRNLLPFLARNALPPDAVKQVPLLRTLLTAGDPTLVVRDPQGGIHFQADLRHAHDVASTLDRLAELPEWSGEVARDRPAVLTLWESVFHHQAFTGRSSTFFAFEGLGSIYWHMVAKLLLAVQECVQSAEPESASALAEAYHDIRRGLGFAKTPSEFGAIPTDPYSHSPRHCGAQQPGMTGQVKEEILTRRGELGIGVRDGALRFEPRLLPVREFMTDAGTFSYVDLGGTEQSWQLPPRALAFTLCQVPICYQLGENARITIQREDGECATQAGSMLGAGDSAQVLNREGRIRRITVEIPAHLLRH